MNDTVTFFNSLSRSLEPFKPIEPGHVRMYTCGPTVHDFAHIGNFRTFIFEDLLRRTLKFHGYQVTHVMNLTDVDDKTIRKSRQAGLPLRQYTARFKEAFFEDVDALRIERAEHYPAATDHIDDMVKLIEALQSKDHTYRSHGSTYFSVASYPEYGRLSGVDIQEDTDAQHSRVDHDEYEKDNARDFALWKAWSPEDGDAFWETPLGKGRPGWHIECSAMSRALLGDHFDIHTGGIDNLFPHHDNEIAQSCAATGADFVNHWLHSEHLLVEGKKMSKSLGNFLTLRDLMARGHSPVVVRYALLSAHYRTQMNLTEELLQASAQAVERLREFERRLRAHLLADHPNPLPAEEDGLEEAKTQFKQALFADLNLPEALGHLFRLVRHVNGLLTRGTLPPQRTQAVLDWLKEVDTVLAVLEPEAKASDPNEDKVKALVLKREEARQGRDWAQADTLRAQIEALGYIVKDTPQGPSWRRI